MDFKTIREFHWLTKSVIILTVLVFVLIIIAAVAGILGRPDVTEGLARLVLSFTSVLIQVFPIIFVIIVFYIIITRVKAWIERYLDPMLEKQDTLAEQKTEQAATRATIAAVNEKLVRMEKQLDNIEHILEKVGE